MFAVMTQSPVPFVFISTAGSCGWCGLVRSLQHSLVQWLSGACVEADGGEQLAAGWQVGWVRVGGEDGADELTSINL